MEKKCLHIYQKRYAISQPSTTNFRKVLANNLCVATYIWCISVCLNERVVFIKSLKYKSYIKSLYDHITDI